MCKIGILTFHYSNNYGGVLQTVCLQNAIAQLGYEVEVINFIPSNYRPTRIINNLGIKKNIFKSKLKDLNIISIGKKVAVMNRNCKNITIKFDNYRSETMRLSKQVNENTLNTIVNSYDIIIVGSDQVWNPSQRKKPEYFLDFGNDFQGKKISYAADSTTKKINKDDMEFLKKSLSDFECISVRNSHSFEFVHSLINQDVDIVADPTLIYDIEDKYKCAKTGGDYILAYILGKEIPGQHINAIEKIRRVYGNLPVYAIKIPTMSFDLPYFAEKSFYDLDPKEWLAMFKNAKFVYTDSFHGVLFSLKYHKPFLAYYAEQMRSTRFIDLGRRYKIEKYIVQNVMEIDEKNSLDDHVNFNEVDKLIAKHKNDSLQFLLSAIEKRTR